MTHLGHVLEPFWIGVAVHLWQTTLFLAALGGLAWCLRRASAHVEASMYWIGVIKLLLPLPLLGPLSARLLPAISGAVQAPGNAAEGGWGSVSVFMVPIVHDPASPWMLPTGLFTALTGLWLLGFGMSARRLVRAGLSGDPARVGLDTLPTDAGERLQAALAVANLQSDSVRLTRDGIGPAVYGLFRPSILLPATLVRDLDRHELGAILIHEREHLRRRDPLRYALLGVAQAVFWFYPPGAWLARRIRETTEMACDEAVVRDGVSPGTYCRSLARALQLGLVGSPLGILGHRVSFLERRLERIRSATSTRRHEAMSTHRLLLVSALAVALAASLMPYSPTASPARAGSSPASPQWTRLAAGDRPVSVDLHAAEIDTILARLEQSAGVTLRVAGRLPEKSLDFRADEQPFRAVLERLGALAGLRFEVTGNRSVDVYPVLLAGMGGIGVPRIIEASRVNPTYPEQARKVRLEGRVILQVLIDRHGAVAEMEVLNSTPPDFRPFIDSAVEAVSQWRYEPATREDDPVDVYFTVLVQFSLDESSRAEADRAL